MKAGRKKLFSFLLAISLTASYLPYNTVLAEDSAQTTEVVEETTQSEVTSEPTEAAQLSLYERLYASTTAEDMDAIFNAASEEEIKTLTADQLQTITDKVNAYPDGDAKTSVLASIANAKAILGIAENDETVVQTVEVTEEPSATPTTEASQEPEVTVTPEATPSATPETTVEPTATPEATSTPEATPSATPEAELSLYEKLMAAETAEEMSAIFNSLEDEPTFTSEELASLTEKVNGFPDDSEGYKAGLLANLDYLATGVNDAMTLENTFAGKTIALETGKHSRSVWDLITDDFGVSDVTASFHRYNLYADGEYVEELNVENKWKTREVKAGVTYTLVQKNFNWGKWKEDKTVGSPVQYDITYPVTVNSVKDGETTQYTSGVYHVSGDGFKFETPYIDDYTVNAPVITEGTGTITDNGDNSYTVTSDDYNAIEISFEYTLIQPTTLNFKISEGVSKILINGNEIDTAAGTTIRKGNSTMTVILEDGYILEEGDVLLSEDRFDDGDQQNCNPVKEGEYTVDLPTDGDETFFITIEPTANYFTVKPSSDSNVSSVTINGKDEVRVNKENETYDLSICAKPVDGYAVSYITIDGTPLDITYDSNGVATAAITLSTESYKIGDEVTVSVATKQKVTPVLTLVDGETFGYKTEDELKDDFYNYLIGTLSDGNGTQIEYTSYEFEFSIDNREVGTRTVTVTWTPSSHNNNNIFYYPVTETVEVALKKGTATVTVNSQTITYGESVEEPLFTCNPTESKVIGFIVGVTVSGDIFVDAELDNILVGDVINEEDIPEKYRSIVKNFVNFEQPLTEFLKVQGKTVSLDQLMSNINDIKSVAEKIIKVVQWFDPDFDINMDVLDNINEVYSQIINAFPDAGDAEVSFGVMPTDAGVYSVWGVTTNPNYKTSIGAGTIVIKQEKETETLSWNNDIGSTLTLSKARNTDFGYTYTGKGEVKSILLKDGKVVDSITSENIESGIYSQTYYVFGNQRTAISRTFIVTKDSAGIVLGERYNGYFDNQQHGIDAYVVDANGNQIQDADISITYYGLTSNGEVYYSSTAPIDAGKYYAKVTFNGNDDYYPAIKISGKIVIKKITSELSFIILDNEMVYGQPFPSVEVGLYVDDESQIDVDSEFYNTLKAQLVEGLVFIDNATGEYLEVPENVGTYTITTMSHISDDIMKNFDTEVQIHDGTLTISKCKPTISLSEPYNGYYDGDKHAVTAELKNEGNQTISGADITVTYTSSDGTVTTEPPVDADTYTVTATYAGDDNHEAAEATTTLTINKITTNFTYMISDKTVVYGDKIENIETALTANDPSQVTDDLMEIIKGYLDRGLACESDPDVGTYTITTNGTVYGDIWKNFSSTITTVKGTLTVTPRAITLKVTGTKAYGTTETDKDYAIKITSGELAYTDSVASLGKITRAEGEDAGTYKFSIDTADVKNYTVTLTDDSVFEITEVATKVVIENVYNGYYDLHSHPVTVYVEDVNGNRVDGAEVTVTYTKNETETASAAIINMFVTTVNAESNDDLPLDAGTYQVIAKYAGDNNHEPSKNTEEKVVIKQITTNFTYTISDKTVVYGDEIKASDFKTTLTADHPDQVTDEILSLFKSYLDEGLTWEAAPAVGTYTVSTNGEVSKDIWDGNFTAEDINKVEGKLTVTKRPITLKVTGTKKYGEKDPAYTVVITSGSLAYNDTLASLGTIKRMSGEGTGTYGFSLENANKNYDVTFTSDSLFTITGKKGSPSSPSAPSSPTNTPGSSSDTSTKKTTGSIVNTGDTSNLIAPMITLMVSAIAVVLFVRKRRSAE